MVCLQEDLIFVDGKAQSVTEKIMEVIVDIGALRTCLHTLQPLSSPHMYGWWNKRLETIARDDKCAEAIATFTKLVTNGRIPSSMTYYMTTATLVIIMKKEVHDIEQLRDATGDAFV
jgi:hypothetical protein